MLGGSNVNSSAFLTSAVQKNTESGNINGIYQTINLVSSSISTVNCTGAPNCTLFHRDSCLLTVNTCSSCQTGYKGIVGDSNAPCLSVNSTVGGIGSVCRTNTDCLYHYCDSTTRKCATPQQLCPSSVIDSICSGNGACINKDTSGNIVQNCTISNPFCVAACSCSTGYGGVDCSLDGNALGLRSNSRTEMCTALTHVISVSQKSSELFDTITTALLSAYDSTEIIGASQLIQCSAVIRFLGTMASRGFLKGTLPTTQQEYAEISSQFVGTTLTDGSGHASRFANDVSNAVSGMIQGISTGLVHGQLPVSIVTSYLRATIIHQLVSSLQNSTFSAPATGGELIYGAVQSSIKIVGNGISTCSGGKFYAQTSTLQYGSNPHANSSRVKSPLLQFSSSISTTVAKKSKKRQLAEARANAVASTSGSFAYYIILQFSEEQSLNLSIQAKVVSKSSNVTLPACKLYDATTAKYVSCGNCSISSYTNFNATFGCYDISALCSSKTTSRRLDSFQSDHHGVGSEQDSVEETDEIVGDDTDFEELDEENEENEENENETYAESNSNRQLKGRGGRGGNGNDDYVSSDDDGPAASDDEFTSNRQSTLSEFGSIFEAIEAELASVLSELLILDLHAATPVLIFVGSLCGLLLLGLMYFLKWDKFERHNQVYLLDEKKKKEKKRIAADIVKGGDGLGLSEDPSQRKVGVDSSETIIATIKRKIINLFSGEDYRKYRRRRRARESFIMESNKDKKLEAAVLISQFTNQVLPNQYAFDQGSYVLNKGKYTASKSAVIDALRTLRTTHYLTAPFYTTALSDSRTLRFIEMSRIILLGLFTDTLIYGLYFPGDSTCTDLRTKVDCLQEPSKVRTQKKYFPIS